MLSAAFVVGNETFIRLAQLLLAADFAEVIFDFYHLFFTSRASNLEA